MKCSPRRLIFTLTLVWLSIAANSVDAQQITVTPDRADGVYAIGETVKWKIEWKGDAAPPANARYTIKSGGLKEVGQGDLKFDGNVAQVETKFDAPNTILVDVTYDAGGKESHAVGGAVADPLKIEPASPPPDDFDAFWKSKIQELEKVAPDPRLSKGDAEKDGVDYYRITLDNIRGTHINGQLARPSAAPDNKFPALLIVQWAGVYPLQKKWVTDRAADGWLALNILPHDLPIDKPDSFYKEQYAGPLKNYWTIGNDDRDKSYYLRMYLSCYRAVDYLRSRDDWDGKTLVVMGTSQGGQQTLMIAGLHPEGITAALPFLPAACDMLAPEIGRASGFPNWYVQTWGGRDPNKVHETSRYYDPINFARKIKCPVLIGCGLRDDLAPPSSVLAAANVIASPKEVIILPKAGHQDELGTQAAYNERCYGAWLPALREGKPPPIAPLTSSSLAGMTAEQDRQRMMELLNIKQLRRGPDGNPSSPNAANSDESKASPPGMTLPDPLKLESGEAVTTPAMWFDRRRPEIVELFDREIYGRVPKNVPAVKWEVVATSHEEQAGVAVVTKQLVGHVDNSTCPQISVDIRMKLTVPAKATAPVPVVMEFSFVPRRPMGATTRSAPPPGFGASSGPTWQQQVIARGWGYALLVATSIQGDNGAELNRGIIGLTNKSVPRQPDDWGALRAWAWGASRALDYLETDKSVDAKRVAIEGLSRYGKAALVTMAYDSRFAVGFIGSSGAGGAKLLRRTFGEQVENLASTAEYHWFCGNFLKYAGPLTPADLPVDAHELIGLCAPRPVFISAGSPKVEGNWIDARGMFLAAVAAEPVYRLLGKRGLGTGEQPAIETGLLDGEIAWRQHSGGHTTGPNWPTFLDYAARYFEGPAR